MANVDAETNNGYSDNQKLSHVRIFGKALIPVGESDDLAVSALGYRSNWDAPSYLDLDLIKRGLIDDRSAVNPTDGGAMSQTLVSLRFRDGAGGPSPLVITAYGSKRDWLRYRSDFLISPSTTQVRQADQRTILGYRAEKSFRFSLGDRPVLLLLGTPLPRDDAGTKPDQ